MERFLYAVCNLIDALILFFLIFSDKGYNGLAHWWAVEMTPKFRKTS